LEKKKRRNAHFSTYKELDVRGGRGDQNLGGEYECKSEGEVWEEGIRR